MLRFDTFHHLPDTARDCVVVIGNFDGLHLGHRALLEQARRIAQHNGKKLAVLTFEPHPRQLFRPDEPPSRITPAPLKAEKIVGLGVDVLYSLTFDWDFASILAEDFVRMVLREGIGAAQVVVGQDFHFGQLRRGTPQTIKDAGIPITVIDKVADEEGGEISSSHVREYLRDGRVREANALLGWPWEIRGEVFRGDRRGHDLGYPTANIRLDDTIHPAYGIYAAFAQIEGEKEWRMGATNIGIRPMFTVPTAQVETYIFDFDREIYGKSLSIRPVRRLRSEAKFNSLEDLKVQMARDCEQAREILEKS